jgi:hypothetical protein
MEASSKLSIFLTSIFQDTSCEKSFPCFLLDVANIETNIVTLKSSFKDCLYSETRIDQLSSLNQFQPIRLCLYFLY